MNKDPFSVLGVTPSATEDEIKSAYRKLAKKYHPDVNNGSADSEAKMKEINEAYSEALKIKRSGGTYNPGAQNSGTFTVLVTGKGSKFAKTGGSTQISSDGGRIYCEDGGRIGEQMSWYSTPKNLVYSFKNGSFFFDGTLSPSGDNCQIILDENSSGESSNSLQLDNIHNGQFNVK